MKRRNFLGTTLASALSLSSIPLFSKGSNQKQRSFRIVHITDMHISKKPSVEQGIAALLNEINSLDAKPDFVLNTGDNISDALKHTKEEVQSHWKAWKKYFRKNLDYRMYSCIGNHDVWGWGLNSKEIKEDPLYGKAWPMLMLELENRYYSFEHKGWKFICLDSPMYAGTKKAYTAKLDDEQFNWLKEEIENTNSEIPICIASHIPILSASVFYDGDNTKDGDWHIPGPWMHIDSKKIKSFFHKHKNVKVALSGHVHLADKTEYLGVNYICNGAACGGWWNGAYQEFEPAYAIVDFYDNGSVESNLIPYNF